MKRMIHFLKDEKGQSMVEYSLIILFVAIASVVALVVLGDIVLDKYHGIINQVP